MKTMSIANVSPYTWCKKWDMVNSITDSKKMDYYRNQEESFNFNEANDKQNN
ncbi:MAG TPA: hypothetical protein PKJ14_05155 [Candidatus Cloacimonadota bacterium]|nr:hypothetical protein [Candidatus Cloacimonadota bacterium]